jgi:dTDP-4-amino-4,6-dideoxygalactose transaminase
MMSPLPVFDLAAQHAALEAPLAAAFARVLRSGWFILGEEVATFEREFAAWLGLAHCVGVASGTDAVTLALRALGIGPGDEVLTVAHTAVATVAAIAATGATPVLVDIDEQAYSMDPAAAARAVTPRTKAMVPVHLYGQTADMDALLAVAQQHKLAVVEDCAQAHGAMYKGRPAGSFGVAAAFSFYPTKNLGALGDGGAVVSNDTALAERVRTLRQYGWRERYISDVAGVNSRLDELQAALLRVKLAHLHAWNAARRAHAQQYHALLRNVRTPLELPQRRHVYHLYVIRCAQRDRVMAALRAQGIGTAIHYPRAVHQQPAYAALAPRGGLPVTERIVLEILSLPMYPELRPEQIAEVAAQVNAATQ